MNPIKNSLDAHRWDGFVTCEQIARVKPRKRWRKWLSAALDLGIVSVVLGLFLTWMLLEAIHVSVMEVARQLLLR